MIDDGKYNNQFKSWKKVKLKEVCTDFIVPMRDKPKIFDGEIPWCRIEDAEGNYLNNSKSGQCVSEKIVNEINLKIFPTGTVICSCSASIGTYLINTRPLITNQTFIGIVTGDKLKNLYLRYYMETQTKRLMMISNASTIPYISRKKFEDMIIPLPPLEEQQKIIDILSTQDKVIELKEKLLKEKEKQKKYLMQNILTGRKRLKGFEGEWKKVKLGEIGDMYAGGTPSTLNMDYWDNGTIKWIQSGLLQNNFISGQSIKKFITIEGLNNSSAKIIKNDSVLIAITGATCANIGYIDFEATANQSVVSITPFQDNSIFIFYLLLIKKMEILKLQGGSAQGGVTLNDLKKIILNLPPPEEQKAIAEILTTADKELKLLQEELEEEKRKKKALMQLLLTGIVRVEN